MCIWTPPQLYSLLRTLLLLLLSIGKLPFIGQMRRPPPPLSSQTSHVYQLILQLSLLLWYEVNSILNRRSISRIKVKTKCCCPWWTAIIFRMFSGGFEGQLALLPCRLWNLSNISVILLNLINNRGFLLSLTLWKLLNATRKQRNHSKSN